LILLGAAGLAASFTALFLGAAWIRPFFYLPVWASTLLVLSGLNKRLCGRSLLMDEPGRFLRMAAVSTPFWLFFEVLNVRLSNWAYQDLPAPLGLRWPGYALAFATVLPAILETAALLEGLFFRGEERPDAGFPLGVQRGSTALGVLFLALPMLWPKVFFGLVWGFLFLLMEPLLAREAPERSWMRALLSGRPGRFKSLLLSGLVCGLLWEAFNYWAGAKWVYTVPWPKGPKLFEMPWLGYLGFLPFALECASFHAWFELRWSDAGPGQRWGAVLGLALLSLAAFWAVDVFTVRSLVPVF
jgi:hypothetical protein